MQEHLSGFRASRWGRGSGRRHEGRCTLAARAGSDGGRGVVEDVVLTLLAGGAPGHHVSDITTAGTDLRPGAGLRQVVPGQRVRGRYGQAGCWYWVYNGDRVIEEDCWVRPSPARFFTKGGSYYSPLAAADRCCLSYPRYPVYACPPAGRRDALGNIRGLADQTCPPEAGRHGDRPLLAGRRSLP